MKYVQKHRNEFVDFEQVNVCWASDLQTTI